MTYESHKPPHAVLRDGFKIDEDLPAGKFYTHEDFPDKVVRIERDLPEDDVYRVPYAKQLLDDLEHRYSIPTVHTQFIIAGKGMPEHLKNTDMPKSIYARYDLVQVSDRIGNHVSVDDALEEARENAVVANEFDLLSSKILRHLEIVLDRGGVLASEYYHYHQYVFSLSANEGERLVLVDTEPIHIFALGEPHSRMPGSVPTGLLTILASCAQDIIRLEKRTGRPSKSRGQVLNMLAKIDSEGHEEVEVLKFAIVKAFDEGDSELLDIVHGDFDEGGDELLGEVTKAEISLEEFNQNYR